MSSPPTNGNISNNTISYHGYAMGILSFDEFCLKNASTDMSPAWELESGSF